MNHIPGYTANSEVNKLQARFDALQQRINECNALIIDRAIDHINEGDLKRGLEILHRLRDSLGKPS